MSPIDIITEPVRADGEVVVVAGDIGWKVRLQFLEFFLGEESPGFGILK